MKSNGPKRRRLSLERPKRQEAMSGEKEKKKKLVEQSETTLRKKLFI